MQEIKKGQVWECVVNNKEARVGDVGRWVSDKVFHLNYMYYTINELFEFNKYFRLLDPMVYGVEIESKMNNEVGKRYNNGKPKWSLMDFDTLEGALKVFEFGTEKYGVDNWKKGLKTTEICESLMRHLVSYLNCDDIDKETNLPHVDHILCNAIMLAYTNRFNKEFDTRRLDKNKKCCGNWDSDGNCKCKQ